jgi:D-galactarolactone cycloisomerase
MSRIRDITVVPVAHGIDPAQAYGMARGLTHRRSAGLVLLATDDGVQGLGEAWGLAGVTRAYLDIVKPYFIGTRLFAQRGVAQAILARHYHMGTQNGLVALLGGIDIAAHDAIGKVLGVSVADLIGGRQRERVPVYASGGYFTADADQEAALSAQLEPLHGSAFGAFKIKIGRSPEEDLWRVRMARRLLGEGKQLAVDANGNYTADAALESMRRIAPFGVHWYEEPLAPQDWGGYAELARRAPIPVATGEALYSVFDFRRVADGRLAAVLQPDLSLCGGFETARAVSVLAAAEHLRLSPHCWGTGVGLAAAVQFVASLATYPHADHVPYPPLVEYDVAANPLRDELLAEPLRLRGGMLDVPAGPGLGIELAPDALTRFGEK